MLSLFVCMLGNYVSRQLQNVTKVDKPNPYVRWVDRWEPESQVDEGHNQSVPQPLLIYNKVPRSGSGVIRTIIKDLMPKLNFTLDHLPSTNMLLNTYMELDIFQQMYEKAAKALNNSRAFVADCYFNFVDVGVYNLPRDKARPNWINVVREPIERYVSHFYYMSRDWRMQNKVLSPEDAKVIQFLWLISPSFVLICLPKREQTILANLFRFSETYVNLEKCIQFGTFSGFFAIFKP